MTNFFQVANKFKKYFMPIAASMPEKFDKNFDFFKSTIARSNKSFLLSSASEEVVIYVIYLYVKYVIYTLNTSSLL